MIGHESPRELLRRNTETGCGLAQPLSFRITEVDCQDHDLSLPLDP